MINKKTIIIIGIILVIGIVLFLGNGIREDGIYGTWSAQGIPHNYLEIRKDGTFAMYALGPGIEMPLHTGIWQMVGNEISFRLAGGLVVGVGRVENNRIIVHMGTPFDHVEIIYARR